MRRSREKNKFCCERQVLKYRKHLQTHRRGLKIEALEVLASKSTPAPPEVKAEVDRMIATL